MLTVRINVATDSGRTPRALPFSVLLRACVCLLLLLGPLAHSPVEGQYLRSPCPNVFSYRLDQSINQTYGYVELHGLRIGQGVKLNIDLSIGVVVSQSYMGSITLVKSREQTFRDIYYKKPAQYRVNFPFNNVIPNVLAISVNGQNICTGQKATGQIVATINLEHTLFAQSQPLLNNNGNNVNVVQIQPTRAPVYQPVETPPPQTVQTIRPQPVQPQRPVQPPRPVQQPPPVQTPAPTITTAVTESSGDIVCGQPVIRSRLVRSINGIRSSMGQFPWASPIFVSGVPSKPKYICGSTIITSTHLVTAAHCMHDSLGNKFQTSDLTTVPGMYNIDNFFEPNLQERGISKIFIHDDYYFEDVDLSDADIAIMLIDQPIDYTDYVRPICLWSESDNLEQIVGTKGYVYGWGITENGDAKYPSYVTATIVSRRDCSRKLDRLIPSSLRVFCGDGQGAVPCNGDNGSGLVIKRGTKYFLRGIVSIGQLDPNTLTCDLGKYVVYTDIAPFRYWMSRIVKT